MPSSATNVPVGQFREDRARSATRTINSFSWLPSLAAILAVLVITLIAHFTALQAKTREQAEFCDRWQRDSDEVLDAIVELNDPPYRCLNAPLCVADATKRFQAAVSRFERARKHLGETLGPELRDSQGAADTLDEKDDKKVGEWLEQLDNEFLDMRSAVEDLLHDRESKAARLAAQPGAADAGPSIGKSEAGLVAVSEAFKDLFEASRSIEDEARDSGLKALHQQRVLMQFLLSTLALGSFGIAGLLALWMFKRQRLRADALEQSLRAMEAANRAKSEFLANMSHELRTPLNGIIGTTELLVLESDGKAEERERLETVLKCGNSLLELLNDVLDLSKIEAGKMELERSAFDLHEVLEHTFDAIGSQVVQKGIEVRLNLSPDLPCRLQGDQRRLRQVLINLCGNAVKFTERGEIVVAAKPVRLTDTEVDVLFSVRDTGIGIAKEQQETIFGAFIQADGSITRKYGGTGLGLTISRRIVELMGGDIWVESEVGKGSTFSFRLPFLRSAYTVETLPAEPGQKGLLANAMRSDPASSGQPEQVDQARVSRVAEGKEPAESRPRVLIVEDNAVNCRVASAIVRKLGYEVGEAESGRMAIEMLERGTFDLVLMDVQMPEMDGLEATRRLRSSDRWKSLPIVAMTAHAMKGDRERCLEAGMSDYLAKPIRLEGVRTMLDKWIRGSPSSHATESRDAAQRPTPSGNDTNDPRPPIEVERALENLGGDRELFGEVLAMFVETIPRQLEELREACSKVDAQRLAGLAHRLKGSASNICAEPTRTLAVRMEELVKHGETLAAVSLLSELEASLEQLREFAAASSPPA